MFAALSLATFSLLAFAPLHASAQIVRTVNGVLSLETGGAVLTLSSNSSTCPAASGSTLASVADVNSAIQTSLSQTQPQINNAFLIANATLALVNAGTHNLLQEQSRAASVESSLSVGLGSERSRALAAEQSLAVVSSSAVQGLSSVVASMVASNNAVVNSSLVLLGATIGAQIFASQVSGAVQLSNVNTSLSTAVVSEQTRAIGVEGSIVATLLTDRSRAVSVDQSLAAATLTLQTNLTTQLSTLAASLTTSINAEQSRAQLAENIVAANVTSERNRAVLAESQVSAAVVQAQSAVQATDSSMAVVLTQTQAALSSALQLIQTNFSQVTAALLSVQTQASQQVAALSSSSAASLSAANSRITQLQTDNSALVGQVAYFASANCPSTWLKCNGAAISRTTYASLFAVIGSTYGSGDGSTTFNVPELRGEFLRTLDDGRGVDVGRTINSPQPATAVWNNYGGSTFPDNNYGVQNIDGSANFNVVGLTVAYTYNSGTRSFAFVRPRNVAMHACIKF